MKNTTDIRTARRTAWNIPVYTGDVSGVCSALYELGGMVVMHDPSGCNSTYNTHDEIRWMDQESLIFISGLRESDAIAGDDRRLIDEVCEAACEFQPAFIAIASSPIPWLTGTDFHSVTKKIQERCRIPCFYVPTNAMHDYTAGAGRAFEELAKWMFRKSSGTHQAAYAAGEDRQVLKNGVNILGLTPLDFTVRSDVFILKEELEAQGFRVVSSWAMGDNLDSLRRSKEAAVNLVVSSAGMKAARWMESELGIPYVAGIPVGAFAEVLYQALTQAARTGESAVPYLPHLADSFASGDSGCNGFAGECVTMGSRAAALAIETGKACALIPLTEETAGLAPQGILRPQGEAQIREALSGYAKVYADPMLECACREGCDFHPLPHFALSGRMYLDQMQPFYARYGNSVPLQRRRQGTGGDIQQ